MTSHPLCKPWEHSLSRRQWLGACEREQRKKSDDGGKRFQGHSHVSRGTERLVRRPLSSLVTVATTSTRAWEKERQWPVRELCNTQTVGGMGRRLRPLDANRRTSHATRPRLRVRNMRQARAHERPGAQQSSRTRNGEGRRTLPTIMA